MFSRHALTGSKPEQYAQLAEQARALLPGERDRIANAANLSALVYHALPDLNWVGFYFFDGTELVVGPFQGLPACVRIPLDKGVCGAAASTRRRSASPTCTPSPATSPATRLRARNWSCRWCATARCVGVFDLDSPVPARFDAEDQEGLEAIARLFVESLAMRHALKLRNIGPKSAAWLRQVGLRTLEDLEAVGAVDAFMRVKRAGFKPSLNLLYALEGALLDCHWQEVPEARRSELVARRRSRHRPAAAAAQPARRLAGDHHADGR